MMDALSPIFIAIAIGVAALIIEVLADDARGPND
jgi:hypothetical protein